VSNEDQHALPPSTPDSAQQPPPGLNPQGAARRRFGRAGLGASGVIMTLASQPGMATTVCRPPSGFLSGTWASTHPKEKTWCAGVKPEVWCAYRDAYWKTLSYELFSKYFPCTARTYSLKTKTLYEIISATTSPNTKEEVAKFMVAAFLNARANLTPILPESKVRAIWVEFAPNLEYKPDAGAKKWGSELLVQYIKSTIPGYAPFVIPGA